TRGEVRLLEGERTGPPQAVFQHDLPVVLEVALSRDGRWLASRAAPGENQPNCWVGEARLWDVQTGKTALAIGAEERFAFGGVPCIALDPTGRWLAVGLGGAGRRGVESEVRLIDVKTRKVRRTLRPRAPGAIPVALRVDEAGRRLVVLSLL